MLYDHKKAMNDLEMVRFYNKERIGIESVESRLKKVEQWLGCAKREHDLLETILDLVKENCNPLDVFNEGEISEAAPRNWHGV
jgi:hypothetical protein